MQPGEIDVKGDKGHHVPSIQNILLPSSIHNKTSNQSNNPETEILFVII